MEHHSDTRSPEFCLRSRARRRRHCQSTEAHSRSAEPRFRKKGSRPRLKPSEEQLIWGRSSSFWTGRYGGGDTNTRCKTERSSHNKSNRQGLGPRDATMACFEPSLRGRTTCFKTGLTSLSRDETVLQDVSTRSPGSAEVEEEWTGSSSAGPTWLACWSGKARAMHAFSDVDPTVVKSVGEARLPEIAKCRATTVFEWTGFNTVLLLSMTVVPIPGGCAKTVFRG